MKRMPNYTILLVLKVIYEHISGVLMYNVKYSVPGLHATKNVVPLPL